jgi:eukaryotic-like serine/threonine-protein kinase
VSDRKQRLQVRFREMTSTNRRIVLLVVGVGLGAFLIGYGLTALAFRSGGAPADVVLVPDVRAMTVEDARQEMSRTGLGLVVGDSFPNPDIPAGAILTQTPLPGQEVSPGIDAIVIVSTGPSRPIVPDVSAMSPQIAVRALQTAGFNVAVEDAPGEGAPGTIVGLEPPAGTSVLLPATVHLRIGGAVTMVAMPTLIGMLENVAREAIAAIGLELVEVLYEPSEQAEPGSVVAQEPAPGDSVAVGSPVRMRVNGRGNTAMPEAKQVDLALEHAGTSDVEVGR